MRYGLLAVFLLSGCEALTTLSQAPPPPPAPSLSATVARPGEVLTLTAKGLLPNAQVWFARASRSGAGPCFGAVHQCLDIAGGVHLMGSSTADAEGVASLSITVPAGAPAGAVAWFQAVAQLAPQGSARTTPVRVEVTVDLCADAQEVADANCTGCHGDDQPSAGLDLRDLTAIVGAQARGTWMSLVEPAGEPEERLARSYLWHKVNGTHLEIGGAGARMPQGWVLEPEPTEALRAWIAAGGVCDPRDTPAVPEEVVDIKPIQRLNRAEYDRSVADLLGTSLQPGLGFPVDDSVEGFDTIAAALTMSTLHAEVYERAAEDLAMDFVTRYRVGGPDLNTVDDLIQAEGPRVTATVGGVSGGGWNLWSVGNLDTVVTVPESGSWEYSVAAWAQQGGPALARMELRVDGVSVGAFDIASVDASVPDIIHTTVSLAQGAHTLTARFTNDYYDAANRIDRNLHVDWLQLRGPTAAPGVGIPGDSPYAAGILCDPNVAGAPTCLAELLLPIQHRAWRRPIAVEEQDRLVGFASGLMSSYGLPYKEAVIGGLSAILLSPEFLFRPELDQNGPFDPTPQPLSGPELASRLSFFLWSSIPDDALLAAAEAGQLSDQGELLTQVHRMLDDPRADALVDRFAHQWLWLGGIDAAAPDANLWPDWTPELQGAFSEETRRFVSSYLREDRDITGLITATSWEVNPDIAAWYGLEQPADWGELDMAAVGRVGLLGQGGLLASLSNPTRSNPVRRGRYVLEQLLCSHTGDPPPGVLALFDPTTGEGSLRDRFAAHRGDPVCASCHDSLDPLGFSLEAFGPAGEAREVDDLGFPVDATAQLPDGEPFEGLEGLASTVAADPRFPLCVAQRLFVYGHGQAMTPELYRSVLDVRDHFVASGMVFEELVAAIVTSDTFLMRGE